MNLALGWDETEGFRPWSGTMTDNENVDGSGGARWTHRGSFAAGA